MLTALNGKADALRRMIPDVDLNAPSAGLYSHGTPLHHAVASGSLEAVKVLVQAGADLNVRDKAWGGTPLGWSQYYLDDQKGHPDKQYAEIAAYLGSRVGDASS